MSVKHEDPLLQRAHDTAAAERVDPPAHLWGAIEAGLAAPTTRRRAAYWWRGGWWAAALVGVAVAGAVYSLTRPAASSTRVADEIAGTAPVGEVVAAVEHTEGAVDLEGLTGLGESSEDPGDLEDVEHSADPESPGDPAAPVGLTGAGVVVVEDREHAQRESLAAGGRGASGASRPEIDERSLPSAILTRTPSTAGVAAELAGRGLRPFEAGSAGYGKLTCPRFLGGASSEVRISAYVGPRFDRRHFEEPFGQGQAYLADREAGERLEPGLVVGLRGEVGKETGAFVGLGVTYGQYRSSLDVLGPERQRLVVDRVFDAAGNLVRVDSSFVAYRDTAVVANRHTTMAFFGTAGYRHRLGKAAFYGAADLGYEVIAGSRGRVLALDGAYADLSAGDNAWVRGAPGLTLGARLGLDVDVATFGNASSALAWQLEFTARRTGRFSGVLDPLRYRYTRFGVSTGLRYRF